MTSKKTRVARWFIFKPKIPIWVNFGDWKLFIHFLAIWNILQTFGIFYGHLVHFVFIWYILSGFGIMCQEKSGNPETHFRVPCKYVHSPNYKLHYFILISMNREQADERKFQMPKTSFMPTEPSSGVTLNLLQQDTPRLIRQRYNQDQPAMMFVHAVHRNLKSRSRNKP
jgi:hypothetical protein